MAAYRFVATLPPLILTLFNVCLAQIPRTWISRSVCVAHTSKSNPLILDLDQPVPRVAAQSKMVPHADIGRVLDVAGCTAKRGAQGAVRLSSRL